MEHWVELAKPVQVGIFVALALVALGLWHRQRGVGGRRLAASFGVLAGVVMLFWLLPDAGWGWARASGVVALVFPLAVAARLSWAARTLATVARRRMRLLSAGVALTAAGVLAGTFAGAHANSALELAVQILSVAAALLFLVGYAPPSMLRMAWRRGEEAALRKAELDVMQAATPEDVGAALLPSIARMLGGDGALLADAGGRVIACYGHDDVAAPEIVGAIRARAVDGPSFADGMLALPLRSGCLVVYASPYAPFFGDDEIALVQRLGLVVDMALERAESAEIDRAAREAVEQAHAEMETLLYTVSHDLKSPLLTVLGYIDLLRSDGTAFDEQAGRFIDRIASSAHYMQQLINDLLELSRIGRREATPEDVDLGALAGDVADELRARHPSVNVGIGVLPVVNMSQVRVRQLITNLLENAVVHSGRADVTIDIGAHELAGGGALVWVGDDGKGVPVEHRERVFGVFERFDERGSGETGNGIGLAACRKIVEYVGGSVALGDVATGARVEITLPAAVVRWQPSPVGVAQ